MKKKIQSAVYQFVNGSFGTVITETSGRLLVFLRPKKAIELSEGGMTIVFKNTMSIPERLMRNAIFKKLEKNHDYNALVKLHKNYWTNKGTELFIETKDAFENVFIPNWTFIFDELEQKLLNSTIPFHTMVEIGTGNGSVLNYLRKKFPKIEKFIGLDLSAPQMDLNREKYKTHSSLNFVAGDAVEWIRQYGQSHTIFITSGGVLEYFTELQLQVFLGEINKLGATIFVAIEPNDVNHNFALNPNFQIYGYERSFSHNYEKIFTNAGFKIWHLSRKASPEDWYNLTFIGAEK